MIELQILPKGQVTVMAGVTLGKEQAVKAVEAEAKAASPETKLQGIPLE